MKNLIKISVLILALLIAFPSFSQKQIKRPKNKVGVSSVDSFVDKSFNMYEQILSMRVAVDNGQKLTSNEADIVQYLTDNGENLIKDAGNLIEDAEHMTVLQQAKAALQVGRAIKALNESLTESGNIILALNGTPASSGSSTPEAELTLVSAEPASPGVNNSSAFTAAEANDLPETSSTNKGTRITLKDTDYDKFKILTDLLESKGKILERNISNGTATFFIAHSLSSYDIADYISNNGAGGYSIESVSDNDMTLKTAGN
ncbi:hypothetical protein ACH3O9_06120 [Leeuwenhoekiella sp. A16]|uniref:hypothetical protein n=1 Tax=unclassified Leeuwenhoekiella TaxID=2615029 RepID=UPI003A7F63EE